MGKWASGFFSWQNRYPFWNQAAIGAGIGAAYGAWSDETSVLGGAIKGAAIGAAYGGYKQGQAMGWYGKWGKGAWTNAKAAFSSARPVIPVQSSFTWGAMAK